MTGVGRTEAVSVHKFRRTARRKERLLQALFTNGSQWSLNGEGVPGWASGVRVERIGRFCFAVIATEERGH